MSDKQKIHVYCGKEKISEIYEGQVPSVGSILIIDGKRYGVIDVVFSVEKPEFSGYSSNYSDIEIYTERK